MNGVMIESKIDFINLKVRTIAALEEWWDELDAHRPGQPKVDRERALEELELSFMPTKRIFDRFFSMPNSHTFQMKPVADLLNQYVSRLSCIIDPFARDSKWATVSNDINPEFCCQYQLDAVEFLDHCLNGWGMEGKFETVLFDPPYSPRQIAECYRVIGRKTKMTDTQNARLYKECRDRLTRLLKPNGYALSFGWNSMGFGIGRGFEVEHVRLVNHGAAHNDTICVVERKAR